MTIQVVIPSVQIWAASLENVTWLKNGTPELFHVDDETMKLLNEAHAKLVARIAKHTPADGENVEIISVVTCFGSYPPAGNPVRGASFHIRDCKLPTTQRGQWNMYGQNVEQWLDGGTVWFDMEHKTVKIDPPDGG